VSKKKHWWSGLKPIYQEGDGQDIRSIYSRKVKEKWEYVLVVTGDDGTPQYHVELKDGVASKDN